MFGALGFFPSYNIGVSLLGIYTAHTSSKRASYLVSTCCLKLIPQFGIFVLLSLLVDLIWAIIPPNKDILTSSDTAKFGLAYGENAQVPHPLGAWFLS